MLDLGVVDRKCLGQVEREGVAPGETRMNEKREDERKIEETMMRKTIVVVGIWMNVQREGSGRSDLLVNLDRVDTPVGVFECMSVVLNERFAGRVTGDGLRRLSLSSVRQ